MCMNEKREPNGHFSYPLGNVISIDSVLEFMASLQSIDLEGSLLLFQTSR